MENITFENLNKQYIKELNTWTQKEKLLGKNGIDKFIVQQECLLGDFLQFAIKKLDDAQVHVAVKNDLLVGFLCTTQPKPDNLYIEYIGVNPDLQNKGYAKKIIDEFKQQVAEGMNIKKIKLDVKKNNDAATNAFMKFAKMQEKQNNSGYISFEL